MGFHRYVFIVRLCFLHSSVSIDLLVISLWICYTIPCVLQVGRNDRHQCEYGSAGFLRISCGFPLGFLQVFCRFPVGCFWVSPRFPVVSGGFPTVSLGFLRVSRGMLLGFRRVACRLPVGFLQVACRFPAGFLLVYRGMLAGFLPVSCRFLCPKHMISGAHFKGHIKYLKMVQNRGRRTWT